MWGTAAGSQGYQGIWASISSPSWSALQPSDTNTKSWRQIKGHGDPESRASHRTGGLRCLGEGKSVNTKELREPFHLRLRSGSQAFYWIWKRGDRRRTQCGDEHKLDFLHWLQLQRIGHIRKLKNWFPYVSLILALIIYCNCFSFCV